MTKAQLVAWAAGFFEGEGSISCSGSGFVLSVKNTDLEMLERFHEAVGNRGKIFGPYRGVRKPLYRWQTGRQLEVEAVVNLLWEFLSERRQDLILEAVEKREAYLASRSEWGKVRQPFHSDRGIELPVRGVR